MSPSPQQVDDALRSISRMENPNQVHALMQKLSRDNLAYEKLNRDLLGTVERQGKRLGARRGALRRAHILCVIQFAVIVAEVVRVAWR